MNNWNYFQEKYGDPIGVGAQCQVYRQDNTVYKVLSVGHKICGVMREGYALALAEEAESLFQTYMAYIQRAAIL